MKKLFGIMIVATVAMIAGYNVYTSQTNVKLSNLALNNMEALAFNEEGGATITCSLSCRDGVGRCYKKYDIYGNCHFNGSQQYSCTC